MSSALSDTDLVIAWHDTECASYRADLALWRELARRGPVLDIGAGTGRVALHLAAGGADVTALDRDATLLAELERRAGELGVRVATVHADARAFDVPGAAFAAILVPMQTVQLLPDADARVALLRCARRHLAPGGVVALAIAVDLEPFSADDGALPEPDVLERDGRRFESRPVALRRVDGGVQIERIRRVDGRGPTHDVIVLADLTVRRLEVDGVAAGLRPLRARTIAPTLDHVGSEVVMLGA